MRPYRFAILLTLAGLTCILLGTAVYTVMGVNDRETTRQHPLKQHPSIQRDLPAALDLTITRNGIYAITEQEIRNANLRIDQISYNNLKLTHKEQAIPFYIDTTNNQTTIYFFGQAVTNTLTAPVVYRLAPGKGTPMRQLNAAPTGAASPLVLRQYRWEENKDFLAQAANGDAWMGNLIMAPDQWQLPLTNLSVSGGPAELTIRVWSGTQDYQSKPDHHLEIALNGRQLASVFWDGIQQRTIQLDLPAGILQPDAENLLTIHSPGDTGAVGEAVYLDWIRLRYESTIDLTNEQIWFAALAENTLINNTSNDILIFDITEPKSPAILINLNRSEAGTSFASHPERQYFALRRGQAWSTTIRPVPQWPVSLRSAEQGADYIAIVANVNGFEEALEPLLEYRRKQGLRVTAVSLAQIFDEFGYGEQTPEAIRDFLAYAYANWQPPAPRYVLLVGDATYDIQNLTNGRNKNLLPSQFIFTEYFGYAPSDTWYAIFDNTQIPQMAIGRFPVQTINQLQTLVNKTLAYETTNNDTWQHRTLLVSDDEPYFNTVSNQLADQLQASGYYVHELDMSQNENIHYDIMSALNKGVGIVNYTGHGSDTFWGDETVFRAQDASQLTNSTRLPILTTFTCMNGAFAQLQTDSLAESLLWANNGGIVAAIAPSARAHVEHQLPLAGKFYTYLLAEKGVTVGEALQRAKAEALTEGIPSDAIFTLNLLGDPALTFHPPNSEEE
ncbi:MAG: hypothetical protein D6706_21725 [Chloroflexi bacterium]|nr:MAG: hypothetical protein D6706_21725 [Chloroflexota bacterium]